MVDSLRGGGFGSPNLTGPFSMGGGNFGQYNIGQDDGADIAYLDKLRAQTAWANGQLTDDAYLAALREYVASTDADTSQRVSAENELLDAERSIGRNRIVREVNKASTPAQKLRALQKLVAYDRRQLSDMTPGNEEYREQQDRIASTQAEMRTTRWNRIYEQYQNGQLTTQQMVSAAQKFAADSRGKRDHDQYQSQVRIYADRLLGEQINEAQEVWSDDPSAGNAKAVDGLLAEMISRNKPGTPGHKDATNARDAFAEKVEAYDKQLKLTQMESDYQNGYISSQERLDFLRSAMGDEEKGTPEYTKARDRFLTAGFDATELGILQGIEEGTNTAGDIIEFYKSQLFWMDPMSDPALKLQNSINTWEARAAEQIIAQGPSATSPAYSGGVGSGHLVYPGHLAPGGRPVNKAGFASQFDGSSFASTNCGMASSAMLAWSVSGGDVKVSGGDMRYYSGDRAGGTWTDDVVRSLDGVGIGGQAYHGMAYSQFKKKLKKGQPAVLTGTSGMLPPELQLGYQGAHSVYVDHVKEHNGKTWYFVMDPLGRGNYKGQYWDEDSLRAFSWKGTAQGTQGSAVFAGKGGNAKKKLDRETPPPKQAFDTDWKGEGTQGRGGGASREEAGPKLDWSDGKPTRPARTSKLEGTSEEAVSAFLAAVTTIEERTREHEQLEGAAAAAVAPADDLADARYDRAVEIIARNGGDLRMAAAEWFTGLQPEGDVASWSQTARFYANAVAKPLGLEPVKKGDVLMPGSPEQPIATAGANTPPGTVPSGTSGQDRQPPPSLGLNPENEQIARDLLDRLGIPATPNAIRMVSAMVLAENGDGTVDGYNPLRLRTLSDHDLPGQIAQGEGGAAVFDTYEEGLDAAADILEQDGPAIIAALRAQDPEAFSQAIADSEWSDDPLFGNAVITSYNTFPNVRPVIQNVLNTSGSLPVSLGDASRSHPELTELLDVDPNDPNQAAWLAENVDAAEAAAKSGAGTWTFEAPDGSPFEVPTSTGIVRDVLYLNMEYEIAVASKDRPAWQAVREARGRFTGVTNEIDFLATSRYIEEAQAQRKAAMGHNDLGLAWEIEQDIARTVNQFLRIDANANPDILANQNPWLTPGSTGGAWDYVVRTIDSLEPYSAENPGGSKVFDMIVNEEMVPRIDPQTGETVLDGDPSKVMVTVDENGDQTYHTSRSNPELFEPKTGYVMDPQTGEPTDQSIPSYAVPGSGWVQVALSDGSVVWLEPTVEENPLIVFYNEEFEEPSKTVEKMVVDFNKLPDDAPGGAIFAGQLMNQNAGAYEQQQDQPSVVPDPDDALIVWAGTHPGGEQGENLPTFRKLVTVDPGTGERITGWSVDGLVWLWAFGDEVYGRSPSYIMKNGAKFGIDDEGNPYISNPPKDGDWSTVMDPYGAPRESTGTPRRSGGDLEGVGGPGKALIIKEAQQMPDGRHIIDAAFTTDDLLQADQIGVIEAMARHASEGVDFMKMADDTQEAVGIAAGTANVLLDTAVKYGVNAVKAFVGTVTGEQLAGPGASAGMKDKNIAAAMQASAASGELFMTQEEARAATAAAAAKEKRITAETVAKAAPAPTPGPAPSQPPTPKASPSPKPTPGPSPSPSPSPKPDAKVEKEAVSKPTYTYGKRTVNGEEVDTVQGGGVSGYR